jgi:tetratricopeptide (TPR) repeat protein
VSKKAIVVAAAGLAVAAATVLLIDRQEEVQTAAGLQTLSEGRQLHNRALALGQPRYYEDAISKFYSAAELDTSLIASALLAASFSHVNLGRPAVADSLADIVSQRRDRLSPSELLFLDLLLSWHLRGDLAGALQTARQLGGMDLVVVAFRSNHPLEAIQALDDVDPGLNDYWFFLTASHHMLGDHEAELVAARRARQGDRDRLSRVYYEVRALAALGRVEEVNARIDEALTMRPEPDWWGAHSTVMSAGAIELRAHGNRAAAIEVAQRAIDWLMDRPAEEAATRAHRARLAAAYYRAERWDEARALYEQLAQEFPGRIFYRGALGTLAARRGDREEALRISDALVGLTGPYDFGEEFYWRADIAALLGERDRAVSLLRDAFARGFPFSQYNPHADKDLESLRDYPPYQELVRPKG